MAPRPKNPPPDRRHEILEAAQEVFARKGYAAATNAEIAKEAGVTAAALYYYFPSKEALFRAAINERFNNIFSPIRQVAEANEQLAQIPPEQLLPFLFQNMTRFFSEPGTQRMLRIILAEGPRNPEVAAIWDELVVGRAAGIMLGYVKRQMDAGQLPQMDPRAFFLLLNGPLFAMVILRDLLGIPLLKDLTNEAMFDAVNRTTLAHLFPPPTDQRKE